MKKAFMCSLCRRGILGGALFVDKECVTFRTNKLTVDEKYRNLILPVSEIAGIKWKYIIFPVAEFTMKTGENYKFIIFNRRGFEKYYDEIKK